MIFKGSLATFSAGTKMWPLLVTVYCLCKLYVYWDAAILWYFLQGKYQLNVQNLMPNLQEGADDLESVAAVFQNLSSINSS